MSTAACASACQYVEEEMQDKHAKNGCGDDQRMRKAAKLVRRAGRALQHSSSVASASITPEIFPNQILTLTENANARSLCGREPVEEDLSGCMIMEVKAWGRGAAADYVYLLAVCGLS